MFSSLVVIGSFQLRFLLKLDATAVVARLLLLGVGHFNSGNATQTKSLNDDQWLTVEVNMEMSQKLRFTQIT